jgi:hypothetical protein
MQSSKGNQSLSEIDQFSDSEISILSTFNRILGTFNLTGINRILNGTKSKGLLPANIFQILLMLPFVKLNNIHSLFLSGIKSEVEGKPDAYYRFMKSPNIPWRRILTRFVHQFCKVVNKRSEDTEKSATPKCIIVDDSILPKTGKKIEFIGKVLDHCTYKYVIGIKLLLVGLWDGKSFLPMDFSLHNEPGKNKNRGLKAKQLEKQYSKQRQEECLSIERIMEIGQSKIQVAINMIKGIVSQGFEVDYVLTDSWFVCENFIRGILHIKLKKGKTLNLIGLMKSNRYVQIKGKSYLLNKLSELKRKQIKYSKKYSCFYIPLQVCYKGIDLKIFLIRMKGQSTWKVLICTNPNLSLSKAMKIYQIRWSIEVFFKDAKQNLKLGNCQSVDFDAHIASISITCMNYLLLALAKRFCDYETIGKLFKSIKDQILKETLVQRIWKVMKEIYMKVLVTLGVEWECFINSLIQSMDVIKELSEKCNILLNLHHSKENTIF